MDEDLLNSINDVTGSSDMPEVGPLDTPEPLQASHPAESTPIELESDLEVTSDEEPFSAPVTPSPSVPEPVAQPSEPVEPSEPVAPAPTPVETPVAPKKKSGKRTTILVSILAILFIGASIAAALYFSGIFGQNGPKTSDGTNVETPLNDEAKHSEVDEIIETIFGATINDAGTIEISSIDEDDIYLYNSRDLTEEQKIWRIVNSLGEDSRKELSEAEIEEARAIWAETGHEVSDSFDGSIKGFFASRVANKYKETFGVDLLKNVLESNRVQYSANSDFYFTTTTPDATIAAKRSYYMSEYLTMDDVIYVYINAARYESNTGEVYCGVFMSDAIERPEICDTLTVGSDFTLDSANSGKFDIRRFDFRKQEDGKYVFVGELSPLNPDLITDGNYEDEAEPESDEVVEEVIEEVNTETDDSSLEETTDSNSTPSDL